MDNILDKIGLYDFFGLLLPGMWFWIMLYIIEFPVISQYNLFINNGTLGIVIYVLVSYVTGSLIQEISSAIFKNLREYPRKNFLKTESKIFKDKELEVVQKCANRILKKEDIEFKFLDDESERVFFVCKIFIERENQMQEADKLDAVFAMSRDFIVVNFGVFICTCISPINDITLNGLHKMVILFSAVSTILFYNKAKRYAKMRVRRILRQYIYRDYEIDKK